MDNKTIFVVTLKGEGEIKNQTRHLSEDVKRALALIDDESTVEKLMRRAAPSLRAELPVMLQRLVDGGFIQDKAQAKSGNVVKMATPKMSVPARKVESEGEELDFTITADMHVPTPESMAAEAAKAKARAEAEARARAEAEAKAKQEAEAARLKVAQEAAKARAEAEAARIKAEQEAAAAKAKAEAEAEARAKQEAEAARLKAEQEAAKARAEAEAARIKSEQEAAAARAQLEAAKAKAEAEAMARAEAEARAKQEAEAARLKAEQEAAKAEAARIKAEQDAAKAKADAEAARLEAERARAEAEAVRVKAEREAAKAEARLKQEIDAARSKAKQDAIKAKAEAEAKARQEAEVAHRKVAEEVSKANADAEVARFKAEQKATRVKAELEAAKVQSEAEAKAKAAHLRAERDAASTRSTIATVLFFDVVGYTKQSVSKQIELKGQFNKLVSEFIKDIDESQRIILDTGDGAAIGFLQHPEHGIEVAMQFRHAVTANKHGDYPELKVRMGIHLGPVNIVKDMNGQSNMVGDGINDAQRIMSFAKADHIYISRPYYDVVSRLTAEYANLFKYHGVEKDKHGREHQVYEVIDERAEVVEQPVEQQGSSPFEINLEPFALNGFDKSAAASAQLAGNAPYGEAPEAAPAKTGKTAAAQEEIKAAPQAEEAVQKTPEEIDAEAKAAAELKARQDAEAAPIHAEQEAAEQRAEAEAVSKMAEEQAKVWADAEQRAKEAAAQAQANMEGKEQQVGGKPQTKAIPRVAKKRGKPLPWGRIITGLVVLSLVLVAVLPYVWPMQDYAEKIENKMSAQLRQPVHIGHLKATLLPLPKLELQDIAVGSARELKAGNVVLNFGFSALFSEIKAIGRVEIDNLTLSAESFDKALGWLQAAGGDANYPVAHMELRHASVSGEGISLPSVNGSADLDAQGHFTKVVLGSEDGKLGMELKPQQSRWQIALNLKESSLPLLPGIPFNELNAKGEVDEGAARFNEIDGRLYGGALMGNANLTWQKDWQMQGHLTVKAMELQNTLPQFGVTGEMEGDANFTLGGAKLPQLTNALNLDGSFLVKKGVINNIDVVEIAANRKGAAGGRTHFDELSGVLQADNSGQHLSQVKISAGVMSANGFIDVSPGRQLSGRLNVDLKMRAGMGSVPLSLSGTAGKPVLR
ncbi:MAG: hypothetical protein HY937_00530 [Nitrosomonadales bacterium]|nr:hypothetical protein [Nitrosomonadales bacterium]